MDSFELNKMLGAFLGVVFILFSVNLLSDTIFSTSAPDTPGYHIEVVEDEPAAPAEEEEAIDIPALLAQADPSNGETAFRRCASCHTTEEGQNRVGPSLWDVIGREVATVDGFSYSNAMSEYGADGTVWAFENLFNYLQDPRGYVPGTTMAFAGLGNDQENADLLAFLREQSDEPQPLPEPSAAEEEVATEEADEAEAEIAEDEAVDEDTDVAAEPAEPTEADSALAGLFAQADTSNGETVFRRCASCHATEEGQNRLGPHLWNIVGREVASIEGFNYSTAMEEYGADGTVWDFQNLFDYFADPRGYVPGTNMAFAGLNNEQDNADLIAFLNEHADEPAALPGAGEAPQEDEVETEAEPVEPAPEDDGTAAGPEPDAGVPADEAPAEGEEDEEAAAPAAEPAEVDPELASLLAQADAAAGETVFRRCAACHTTDDGVNRVGPHLWDIVGREVASVEGFRYSGPMSEYGADGTTWEYQNLFDYLDDPRNYVPGTTMVFPGLGEEDNANLIAYLREQSDEPAPLPGE